ncbi:MAG: NFACT RNA binding domain-containing protein [Oligoflexia bacterium]|nr:NFACT RNA binding domain-containing protein [Oligoflexia bacterium]
MSWPVLNWKELARLVAGIGDRVVGLHLERIVVPERPRFPSGYLKGEWVLRFSGRGGDAELLISVRPRHPGVALLPAKGPRAAPEGTRSAFDLALSKRLRGARLLALEALPRERTVVLWFASDSPEFARLGLALNLIPAVPEAILFGETPSAPYPVLARSRPKGSEQYIFPDGAKAPPSPEVRETLVDQPHSYAAVLETSLQAEAFSQRLVAAQRAQRELLSQARERIRQNETSVREGENEPDWQRYGDLLKATLGQPPPLEQRAGTWFRRLPDYFAEEEGIFAELPCDPKLSPQAQTEKFYQLARRKQRRISEARARLEDLRGLAARLEKSLEIAPPEGDWEALSRLEKTAGLQPEPTAAAGRGAPKKHKTAWLGRSFVSQDGWAIWVGRSKDENLELTFKHARGNDLWMHVRGRPGAHAVIPVQPGKSVPLETLLDAAALTVYYSGGEKWGKTEVDYTLKKHVKRIKDSTEASYTHNKTLIIEPDGARLKRLLASRPSEEGKEKERKGK